MNQEEKIAILTAENAALHQRVSSLEDKVLLLLQQIEQQGTVKKDSHNSHNPPSHDKYKPKKKRSLRKKTGRKTGGQKGHKGRTKPPKAKPDEIHDLKSDFCQSCASDISNLTHTLIGKRQLIELPPIVPIYKEYRQYGCLCPCGHHQKAAYPNGVNAPVQFGSSVIALVAYFNIYQYVPYARLQDLFKDLFNLSISQGSIDNLLKKAAEKATPFYQAIFEKIKVATYVGADETGAKVNGTKWWIWVWQNVKNTFIKASDNRGFATVEESFPDGLPNATIGSDRWAAQLKMESANKQLCLAHLLRDLIFLIEVEKNEWATHFKDLLNQALKLRYTAIEINQPFIKGQLQTYQLEHRLNRLLARCIDKEKFPKTCTFQRSMMKNRNFIFSFLYDLEVPPDNNASERAIRNIKVKQKISGHFKSGQHIFCTLRSVVDTLRKRQLDVFSYLQQVMAI